MVYLIMREALTKMLWSLTREQIIKAILTIAKQRGLEIKKVYSLTTGLWVAVQLSNGHILNINDFEIQEAIQ